MGLEALIENDARLYMQSLGGVLMKFVSPGNKGVPDRIASHINCGPFMIELKAPTKTLEKHQRLKAQELANAGVRVYGPVDSIKMAREVIEDEVFGRLPKRHPPRGADW